MSQLLIAMLVFCTSATDDACGGCAGGMICASTPDYEYNQCVSCENDKWQKTCGGLYDELRLFAAVQCSESLGFEHEEGVFECEGAQFCENEDTFRSWCARWTDDVPLQNALGDHCLKLCPPHAEYHLTIEGHGPDEHEEL
jgi:hypothetical protein